MKNHERDERMNVMLMLNRDDIQKEIPYGIVCETR